MHPEMNFDLAMFRIDELHRQAAEARLARGWRHHRSFARGSKLWSGLRPRKLRTKAA